MRGNGMGLQGNRNIAREVAALKVQLKKLTEALEGEANDGIERAVDKVQSKGKEAIDQAIEAAQAFIDEQAESARDAARALAKKSTEVRDAATESLVETVQARPLSTLAAVIGIGFLAGYLCRRH
jgi:ElaB/YqjD/DUF883 family membrane-anchored ribosome-binding protein